MKAIFKYFSIIIYSLLLNQIAMAEWNVWLDHSVKKYRMGGEDGISGRSDLNIMSAKNEFESFQILIYADGENLVNVDVEVDEFIKGGDKITDVYLYKMHYVNCRNKSRAEYETGWYPDALLPKIDRYYNETRSTFPFSVNNGNVQGVWVDVGTEMTTNPGTYTSVITVSANGKQDKQLTISLTVWDFAIPSTSLYPTVFPYERSYMSYGHGRGIEWQGQWQLNMGKLYNKCALLHRISSGFAGGTFPSYSWSNGILTITAWGNWLEEMADIMNGESINSGTYHGAKFRAVNAQAGWAVIDRDNRISNLDKQSAQRQFLQQVYDEFDRRGWEPFEKLFVPVSRDEPNGTRYTWRGSSMTDYEICIDNARDVNSVNTHGLGAWKNIYINKHNVPEISEFSSMGFYDPWVGHYICDNWDKDNWPCSNGYAYIRSNYSGYPNEDYRHWVYLSCMNNGCSGEGNSWYDGQIDWSADAPAYCNRFFSIVFWKYEVKGTLYWGMNQNNLHASNNPYIDLWYYGSNGDGHLFYPGVADVSGKSWDGGSPPPPIGGLHDIPIASIRLKAIRDGMEDLEYMEILKDIAGKSAVDKIVNEMFTNADVRFAYWSMKLNISEFLEMRKQLGELISPGFSKPHEPQGLDIIKTN